jgi:hypothetical protein
VKHIVTHRYGGDSNLPPERFEELFDELDEREDEEHPCVCVRTPDDWALSYYESGLLVWENTESGEPRHMKSVDRGLVLKLWRRLAIGDLEAIEQQDWRAGYG